MTRLHIRLAFPLAALVLAAACRPAAAPKPAPAPAPAPNVGAGRGAGPGAPAPRDTTPPPGGPPGGPPGRGPRGAESAPLQHGGPRRRQDEDGTLQGAPHRLAPTLRDSARRARQGLPARRAEREDPGWTGVRGAGGRRKRGPPGGA